MREIKFRAWDTQTNKWLEFVPPREGWLDSDSWDDPEAYMDSMLFYPATTLGRTFGGRIIYQQYTGIKDKDGKEIYEGDILKTEGRMLGTYFRQGNEELPAWPESKIYTWIAKVVWDDGYASFMLEYINQPDYQGRGNFKDEMIGTAPWGEVIGNIFENPELLK